MACGCTEGCNGEVNDSPEHRRHQLALRNGALAADISEQVRLGLMDPEEAREKVRKMGR